MNERIKILRKSLDLTQQELADRIGIARGNIGAYEVGKNAPSDAVISLICREFNVSEEWLRNGTGDMFVPEAPDELSALVKKYGLSDSDQVLVEKYISLKPQERDAVIRFITDVSATLGESSDYFNDVPDTPEELEAMYPPVDVHKNSDVG